MMVEMKFTFRSAEEAAEFLAKLEAQNKGPKDASAAADYLQRVIKESASVPQPG